MTAFSDYNRERFPDISALLRYAIFQNEQPSFVGEKAARFIFMICGSGRISEELFGPSSIKRLPYKLIVEKWERSKFFILTFARVLTYPIGFIYQTFDSVFRLLGFKSSKKMKLSRVD
jgi:hypothetical protein